MTYEEANKPENIIKMLNKRRMCPCGYCTDDKCVPEHLMDACLKQDFVINKAIEALEKQIAKKPIRSHNGIKSVYECPVCHYPLLYKCGCYNNECRQMIDWSEEE